MSESSSVSSFRLLKATQLILLNSRSHLISTHSLLMFWVLRLVCSWVAVFFQMLNWTWCGISRQKHFSCWTHATRCIVHVRHAQLLSLAFSVALYSYLFLFLQEFEQQQDSRTQKWIVLWTVCFGKIVSKAVSAYSTSTFQLHWSMYVFAVSRSDSLEGKYVSGIRFSAK